MMPMIKRIQSLHTKGHPVSLRLTIDRVFVRRGDGGKLLVKWTYKGKQKGASAPVTVANGQGLVNESIDLQNLTMYPNQEKVVKFKLYEVVSSRGGEESKPIKVMEFLLDLSRTYYDSFHEKGLTRKEVLLDAADCPTALTVTVEVAPPASSAPSSAASAPSVAAGVPGSSFGIGVGGGVGGTASGTLPPGGVCSTLAPSDGNTPQDSSMRDLFVTTSNVSGDGHLGVSVGAVSNGGGSGAGGGEDVSPSAWKRRVSDLYKRNHAETGQKSQEEIDALLQCYQGDERSLYERLMQKYEPERAAAEAEAAAAEAEAEAKGVAGGGGGSGGSGGQQQQQQQQAAAASAP
eukprot:Rhum_TRINITY_DN14424_c27_g1::Rhum_TRINITY_DN14424_c27_g1_i1::g.89223::m.89223